MTDKLLSLMLLVACALTLTSCSSDDETEGTAPGTRGTLTLIADMSQDGTRTQLGTENGMLKPMWSAGDTLFLMSNRLNPDAPDHFMGGKQQNVYMFKFNSAQPAAKASFEFIGDEAMRQRLISDVELNIKEANKMIAVHTQPVTHFYSQQTTEAFGPAVNLIDCAKGYALYNADRLFLLGGTDECSIVKDRKTFLGCDMLVSQDIDPGEIKKAMDSSTPLSLRFKRVTSVVRLNLINKTNNDILEKENITTVSLSRFFNPDYLYDGVSKGLAVDGPSTMDYVMKAGKGNLFTFNADRSKDDNMLYFSTAPFTYTDNFELYITLTNDKGSFFIITLQVPQGGIPFEAGKITTLNVSITNLRLGHGFVDYSVDAFLPALNSDDIL